MTSRQRLTHVLLPSTPCKSLEPFVIFERWRFLFDLPATARARASHGRSIGGFGGCIVVSVTQSASLRKQVAKGRFSLR